MAGCNITDGIGRPACPGETPGAKDSAYLYNTDDVASYSSTGDLITAINFKPGKGYYKVTGKKGSIECREELQDDDSGVNYTHEFDIRFADLSPEARDFVNSLNGPSLGAVIPTKGDKFILYGYNDGVQMKVNKMSTTADELGEFVTFREIEVNEKTRRFLDTDPDTTIETLENDVVGS